MMRLKPILVGGTGRSGTTIVKRVLTQRPQIARVREELRLLSDPGGLMDLYEVFTRTWTPFRGDAAWKRFTELATDLSLPGGDRYTRHALSRWFGAAWEEEMIGLTERLVVDESHGRWTGISELRVLETTSYRGRGPELGEALREMLSRLFLNPYPDARWWVDDTPELMAWFGHPSLVEALDPVMVCMIRHPFDIYASHVQRRQEGRLWHAERPLASAHRVRQGMEHAATLDPSILFRLEDLVSDPRSFQEQLAAQAGGPIVPMTDFEVVDPARAHIGRFSSLNAEEKLVGRNVLSDVAEQLGYTPL